MPFFSSPGRGRASPLVPQQHLISSCRSGTGSLRDAKPHTGQEAPCCSCLLAPGRGMVRVPAAEPQQGCSGASVHDTQAGSSSSCQLPQGAVRMRCHAAHSPADSSRLSGKPARQIWTTGAPRCPSAALGIPGDWSSGWSLHSEISLLVYLVLPYHSRTTSCTWLPRGRAPQGHAARLPHGWWRNAGLQFTARNRDRVLYLIF